MYVCLCNALTDTRLRELASAGVCRLKDVYAGCGCASPCGRCAAGVLRILREAPASPER
jgi:bacterioferritin-associated ferredoxin